MKTINIMAVWSVERAPNVGIASKAVVSTKHDMM